jgi:hypothetical protein
MIPSQEALAILAARERPAPNETKPGDIWHICDMEPPRSRPLEYVMLVLGHRKQSRRKRDGHTYVYLYHWGAPSLTATPATLRDNDCNAIQAETSLQWSRDRGHKVRYLGNLFKMLPLERIAR